MCIWWWRACAGDLLLFTTQFSHISLLSYVVCSECLHCSFCTYRCAIIKTGPLLIFQISGNFGVAKDALAEIASRLRVRCLRDANGGVEPAPVGPVPGFGHPGKLPGGLPSSSGALGAGSSGGFELSKVCFFFLFPCCLSFTSPVCSNEWKWYFGGKSCLE